MPKVWLITGSSGSLGRTIAEAALAAGDKVLATAREPARLQDLVHCYGSRIRTVQHDIRKRLGGSNGGANRCGCF